MADGFVRLREGEKRPIYGKATAATGTLTIQSSPVPKVTFYDSAGVAIAALTSLDCTGYDASASAAPRVWYNLDTDTPANLAPGFYTATFLFTAAGSDSLTRRYEPSVDIQIMPTAG